MKHKITSQTKVVRNRLQSHSARQRQKKPTGPKILRIFNHVGILSNRPPGTAGLPFIKSSNTEHFFRKCSDDGQHSAQLELINRNPENWESLSTMAELPLLAVRSALIKTCHLKPSAPSARVPHSQKSNFINKPPAPAAAPIAANIHKNQKSYQ